MARTAETTLERMVCFALYSANRQVGRVYAELLAPWHLTYTQYLALLALRYDDGLTVGRLGELLGLDSGTLSPLLKRLEGRGYVRRRRSGADERVVELELSDEGRALGRELEAVPQCFRDRIPLPDDDLTDLLARLHGLSAGVADVRPGR